MCCGKGNSVGVLCQGGPHVSPPPTGVGHVSTGKLDIAAARKRRQRMKALLQGSDSDSGGDSPSFSGVRKSFAAFKDTVKRGFWQAHLFR